MPQNREARAIVARQARSRPRIAAPAAAPPKQPAQRRTLPCPGANLCAPSGPARSSGRGAARAAVPAAAARHVAASAATVLDAQTALAIELARARPRRCAPMAELCHARDVGGADERVRALLLGTWSEAGSAAADPLLPGGRVRQRRLRGWRGRGATARRRAVGGRVAGGGSCRAGVAATDAAAAAAALGAASDTARVEVGRAARDAVRARPPNVTVETHADDAALRSVTVGGAGAGRGDAATLTSCARSTAATPGRTNQRAAALLLRYDAIGGAGLHASLGADVHEALREAAGCAFECCASPLNTYFGTGAYCSPFADVEAPFGSRGSFAAFSPARGSFEVNPPFGDGMIDAVVCHLLRLLAAAQVAAEALTFVVVRPGGATRRLARTRRFAVAAPPAARRRRPRLYDGAQHARRASFRQSPYD